MHKNKIVNILSSVRSEAKRRYKVEIMGLFGSRTRGSSSGDSDVDVLVRFSESADLFDLVGVSHFLEEKLNCKVDVVPEDSIRPELREAILDETIYL